MAVYRGVLEQISEGEVISSEGTGGYWTHRMGIMRFHRTGVDSQWGWTSRQFVDIGGRRIRNVVLMPFHDQLLQEALGQEVALSMTGPDPDSPKRHTVVAIRTPRAGLNRPGLAKMIAGSAILLLRGLIAAPVFFLIALFVAWVAHFIYLPLWWVGLVVGIAGAIGLVVAPLVWATNAFRARAALHESPGTDVANTYPTGSS
jgi:hypothetical protein